MLGDPDRLQQVVWNLVSNAVKFTPAAADASRCGCAKEDSHVALQVRDTGKGITPDFLPFVFDRFRQADSTSTRSHGGLGLGLAIVRHLVELHGGTVARRERGRRTGRDVHRPPSPHGAVGAGERAGARTPDAEAADDVRLDGVRVLVLEDENDVRDFLRVSLVQYGARGDGLRHHRGGAAGPRGAAARTCW